MTVVADPAGYSRTQVVLHWTIAALVILQLIIGEDIKPAYRAFAKGNEPLSVDVFWANIHIYAGLAVLVLAIWRLAVRMKRGVPAAPSDESIWQKRIATAAHFVLYVFIFAMPITGALAWYVGFRPMGEIHELAKPVIIGVVALHAAAALWHHFYMKTNVLVRMLRPQRQN